MRPVNADPWESKLPGERQRQPIDLRIVPAAVVAKQKPLLQAGPAMETPFPAGRMTATVWRGDLAGLG